MYTDEENLLFNCYLGHSMRWKKYIYQEQCRFWRGCWNPHNPVNSWPDYEDFLFGKINMTGDAETNGM